MHLNLTRLSHFIEYNHFNLHYKKIGSGPKIIIAFHGFGQNTSAYNCVVNQFNKYYTIYLAELFFHGKTVWKKKNLFLDKQIWGDFFTLFLQKEKIESFSLIGFSIGAKLALASFETTPNQVKNLILIAPDGIKENFWYALAVNSTLGRFLLKSVLNNAPLFVKFLNPLQSLGLLNSHTYIFIKKQVLLPGNTDKIYKTWISFKNFVFHPQKISKLLNQGETSICIFIGHQDPWFTQKNLTPAFKACQKT